MFDLVWTNPATRQFADLKRKATRGKARGLHKQVAKALKLLREDPRHPGLQTHEYMSLENPYDKRGKVLEAYAQHKTPGAYRVFWCYGPKRGEITVLAITPHP